jgi:hypothetical protein
MEVEEVDKNTLSNADISTISFLKNESEILIFPFSCFEVKKIDESNDIKIITLDI